VILGTYYLQIFGQNFHKERNRLHLDITWHKDRYNLENTEHTDIKGGFPKKKEGSAFENHDSRSKAANRDRAGRVNRTTWQWRRIT